MSFIVSTNDVFVDLMVDGLLFLQTNINYWSSKTLKNTYSFEINGMSLYYILIISEPMKEHQVYNTLKTMKEIHEVHPLFGEYDLLTKIEYEKKEDAEKFIIEKIKSIPGVQVTKTLRGI